MQGSREPRTEGIREGGVGRETKKELREEWKQMRRKEGPSRKKGRKERAGGINAMHERKDRLFCGGGEEGK
jgi:hypothetical protein